jgi:hypothetical protein
LHGWQKFSDAHQAERKVADDGNEHPRGHKFKDMTVDEAILVFLLLAFCIVIGAPVLHELEHMGLNEWLYRWSTLFTGVLAVAAAVFTIRKMQHIDDEQGRRHRQQMQLALRSENRQIERALYPQVIDLETNYVGLRRVYERMIKHPQEGWYGELYVSRHDLGVDLHQSYEIFDRSQFRKGRELLDGMTTAMVSYLEGALAAACTMIDNLPEFSNTPTWILPEGEREEKGRELGGQLEEIVTLLKGALPRLHEQLETARSRLAVE